MIWSSLERWDIVSGGHRENTRIGEIAIFKSHDSLSFYFCYLSVHVHLIKSWWEYRLMLTQASHTLRRKQSLQNGILTEIVIEIQLKSRTWGSLIISFRCAFLICIFGLLVRCSLSLADRHQEKGERHDEEEIRLHVTRCLSSTKSSLCQDQINLLPWFEKYISCFTLLTNICTKRRIGFTEISWMFVKVN